MAQPDAVTAQEPFAGFEPLDAGAADGDSLLHFDYDLTVSLGRRAGSFMYDFGAFGWPAGWSYLGASPNHAVLYWQGIPFDDLVTGRPRYDLLPTALLSAPGVALGARSVPVAVLTRLRAFDASRPLTELHYQAGDNSLQRITALHTQRVPKTVMGRPGLLQGLFAYAGGAAVGEYAGSRLQRMRQLLLGAQYQQVHWSLEALFLHNQRRLGAHGGVVPVRDYESVYNRLTATTRDDKAVRRDVRHDASVTLRVGALALQAWHVYARMRYTRAPGDAAEVTSSRWGLRLRRPVEWGAHRMRILAEGYMQGASARAHAALRDSVGTGAVTLAGEAGVSLAQGTVFASAAAEIVYRWTVYASAFSVGIAPSRAAIQGFGNFVVPLSRVPIGRTEQIRLGARIRRGILDVDLFGFAGQEHNLHDFYGQRSDSAVVRVHEGALRLAGVVLDAGLRRSAQRGFYAHAHALRIILRGSIPRAREEAVPALYGQGRIGARYRLFTGDLRLDVSVRARLWTAMTSRMLHAPTGLLTLPEDPGLYPEEGRLPASAVVDIVAEAGVRTAVLFAAYENILSGSPLMAGNQIVPLYPLPAIRLRFGVFWPIVN